MPPAPLVRKLVFFFLRLAFTHRNAERLPMGLADPLSIPKRDALPKDIGLAFSHNVIPRSGVDLSAGKCDSKFATAISHVLGRSEIDQGSVLGSALFRSAVSDAEEIDGAGRARVQCPLCAATFWHLKPRYISSLSLVQQAAMRMGAITSSIPGLWIVPNLGELTEMQILSLADGATGNGPITPG